MPQLMEMPVRNDTGSLLTEYERGQILSVIAERELINQEIALRSPWYFCSNYVKTLDEHDPDNPIKSFPNYSYLEQITEEWERRTLIIIAKSRQMMMTWLFAALHIWLALREGRLIFFVSKKEEDADAILKRAKFIYNKLPTRLKWGMVNTPIKMDKEPPVRSVYCHLEFPWLNSEIISVPQGSDILRSRTASAIFSDEMAFQENAQECYTSAKPTIDGGGKFTAVTTPNGQEFAYKLLFDL